MSSPSAVAAELLAAARRNHLLQLCLGSRDRDEESETDFQQAEDVDSEHEEHYNNTFTLADSDDEGVDEEDEAYNFDPEIVSELIKKGGYSIAELTEKFEAAMTEALERRLKGMASVEEFSSDNPYGHPTCEGDLEGRMTPPDFSDRTESFGMDAGMIASKLEEARQQAVARAHTRRSSVVNRDAISAAMAKAVTRHRRSLVAKAANLAPTKTSENNVEAIQRAMQGAHRRHRMSIAKAAETLEMVYGDANCNLDQVPDQLQLVQRAMEAARRRHRQSIAQAVTTVTCDETATDTSALQQRINEAVAEAYKRQNGDTGANGFLGWPEKQEQWVCQPTCSAHQQYADQPYELHHQERYGYQQQWYDCKGQEDCSQTYQQYVDQPYELQLQEQYVYQQCSYRQQWQTPHYDCKLQEDCSQSYGSWRAAWGSA